MHLTFNNIHGKILSEYFKLSLLSESYKVTSTYLIPDEDISTLRETFEDNDIVQIIVPKLNIRETLGKNPLVKTLYYS